MRNYIKHTLWFVWLVLLVLLGMYWLPNIVIAGHEMRPVDLLSDLRPSEPTDEIPADSLLPPIVKPAFVDTCRNGMTCIEDYSDSTQRGMHPFYEAIDRIQSKGELVRIAVFGDSFIEADIFTSDLREMLQRKFGGCGVGFVPVTSETSGYRPTVRHTFGGWTSHSVVGKTYFDKQKQGVSGHYFVPQQGAYVELRGQKSYASFLDTCQRATIFFKTRGYVRISARVNKEQQQVQAFSSTNALQQMQVKGSIGSVRWDVEQADSTLFYGMALDGTSGIVVDNFSLRGSSGLSLRTVPVTMMSAFNKLRPYDLIILQYGLNVATERGHNYDNYQRGLLASIARLKENFPHAGFLLLSIGDRGYKTASGEVRTMPGVKSFLRYQQNIAFESGIAFWNLYEAMGGEGSMVSMVRAKPSLANYDYTHINFRGGKHLAKLLYETLIYGKENYDRKRVYEQK